MVVQPMPIEPYREQIEALCRKHRVRALYLFGSAASSAFDPGTSDFDFQVDLGEYHVDIVDRFFDLQADLERLLGRDVDLISTGSAADTPFRRRVDASRLTVFHD